MVRLVSWNMAHKVAAWAALRDVGADVALVQEAGKPSLEWANAVSGRPDDRWETALVGGCGPWRTAILRLSDRVELRPRTTMTLETSTAADDWVVSRAGSIAAADVVIDGQMAFTALSVYAAWEMAAGRGFADGSAHRILSDISSLDVRRRHPLIV